MDASDIVEAVVPDDSSEPLVQKGFEYEKRKYNDVCFTVFYAVLMILSGGVAIFGFFNRNDDWRQLYKQDYLTELSYCTAPSSTPATTVEVNSALALVAEGAAAAATQQAIQDLSNGTFMEFLDHAWYWLLGATLGAIVLGFVFLLLFSYFAIAMVYLTVTIIVAIPIGAGIYEFIVKNPIYGGILVGVGFILCLLFMCLRTKLNMVAKLLDSAADGVRENLQLIFFALGTMIMVIIISALMLALGVIVYSNGNFELNSKKFGDDKDGCYSVSGQRVACCKYNVANWVVPYYVLLAFMALWNLFLMSQIRVYVVSGVIAQWYFADEGDIHVPGKTRRSFRHALGPSFGSICLSSIIVTIGQVIRWVAEKLKRDNKKSWFWWLVNCCVQGIISLLEFLTEFATVHMAITGESFWESGKDTVQMLKRNFINAYTIWWVPPIILGLTGVVLSGSVSIILGTTSYFVWNDDLSKDVNKKYSIYLGLCTLFLILVVIMFFSRILLDTVSAVFVCFAMDRDNRQETRHKIHEVMCMMPSVGAVEGKDKGEVRKRDLPYEAPPMV
ncbi:hypothetical protein BSKO_08528 [Bryopsis sp. KO-2023]|nr:hypothetical protein BSKO_08528 [Bryopsis sp. KO-2023]